MKKTLLAIFLFLFGVVSVRALTPDQKQEKIETALGNYHFEFKYINMDDNVAMIKNVRGEDSWPDPKEAFLNFLVRADLEKTIGDLSLGFDIFCYTEGQEYQKYDEELEQIVTRVAEEDMCNLYILVGDSYENCYGFETIITGSFEEVEGDANYKKEALSIANQIQKDFYVNDMDIINHMFNYKSSTATFFQGNNVTTEFSDVKKAVEEYPDYSFFAGLEEVRRGDYFVGLEEGVTYIARDGIIYGYALNTYGAGTLFYVPLGTQESDYIKIVEQRIKDYLKEDGHTVKVTKSYTEWYDGQTTHKNSVVNAQGTVLNLFGLTEDEYYQQFNSSLAKEKAKLQGNEDQELCDEYGCIAVPVYKLVIDDQELEIGIIEVPEDILNSSGITSSYNIKTGIIIRTSSSNVPLDAVLDIDELELSSDEKSFLEAKGYKEIKTYDLNLFSKILNKYIEKFNDDCEILIPVEEQQDNIKVLYVSDDKSTIEKYDVEYVTYNNKLYMSFKTSHFSNYIIVEDTNQNPGTGDNILRNLSLLLVSSVGLSLIYLKRYKRFNQ